MAGAYTDSLRAELRARINPIYQNQIGTESWERKILLDEIDRLAEDNAKMKATLAEWGINAGPPIIIRTEDLPTKYEIARGDYMRLSFLDSRGEHTVLESQLPRPSTIDHATIFEFDDALGYHHAYAGFFGQKSDDKP